MILIKYFYSISNIIILINILLIPKYQIFILLANWKKVLIFHNYFFNNIFLFYIWSVSLCFHSTYIIISVFVLETTRTKYGMFLTIL